MSIGSSNLVHWWEQLPSIQDVAATAFCSDAGEEASSYLSHNFQTFGLLHTGPSRREQAVLGICKDYSLWVVNRSGLKTIEASHSSHRGNTYLLEVVILFCLATPIPSPPGTLLEQVTPQNTMHGYRFKLTQECQS